MQLANALVAIGGDSGNTVPKYNVTPSEVAVLRVIHSEDAVTDIEITGADTRSSRTERERLAAVYGGAKDENQNSILTTLFPGIAARMFETFEELGLDESFYKAERTGRQQPVAAVEPEPAIQEPQQEPFTAVDTPSEFDPSPLGATDPAPFEETADKEDEDGIGDMNDDVAKGKSENVLG